MEIGDRIRQLRKGKLDISQEALAELVGASQTAVTDWENNRNKPRRDIVPKIAEALGVSVAYLEYGDDAPPAPATGRRDRALARARDSGAALMDGAAVESAVTALLHELNRQGLGRLDRLDPDTDWPKIASVVAKAAAAGFLVQSDDARKEAIEAHIEAALELALADADH